MFHNFSAAYIEGYEVGWLAAEKYMQYSHHWRMKSEWRRCFYIDDHVNNKSSGINAQYLNT